LKFPTGNYKQEEEKNIFEIMKNTSTVTPLDSHLALEKYSAKGEKMKSGEKRQQSVIIDDTAMQAEVRTEYLQNSFRARFLKGGGRSQQAATDGPNLLKT